MARDAEMSASVIERALRTRCLGRKVIHLPSTTSTQDEARRRAEQGAPEGLLVIAEEQTRGRGRFQRSWVAPRGAALLLSLVLRPPLAVLPRIHMIASLGAVRAVRRACSLDAAIKWPNDVQIGGRKVAGILVDAALTAGSVEHVVVGIGLNVSFDPAEYPEIAGIATSLSVEAGRPVDRLETLSALLTEVEELYETAKMGEFPFAEWKGILSTLGNRVRVTWPGGAGAGPEVHEGIAEDVTDDGALLLRTAGGSLVPLVAGEVSLRW